MYKNLYRRMRVLLHRYPLLPFLLAATLAVDAFAIFQDDKNRGEVGYGFATLIIGFLIAQFCLMGIWVGYRLKNLGLRLGIAVVVTAVLIPMLSNLIPNSSVAAFIALMLASLLAQLVIKLICYLFTIRSLDAVLLRFKVMELLLISTATSLLFYEIMKVDRTDVKTADIVHASVIGFLTTTLLWNSSLTKRWSLRLLAPSLFFMMLGLILILFDFYHSKIPINSMAMAFSLKESIYFLVVDDYHRKLGIVVFTLLWAYGMQVRRHPIRQRKKKQQATPNEAEQPAALKVVNQDEEPTEPPGPIDLTV